MVLNYLNLDGQTYWTVKFKWPKQANWTKVQKIYGGNAFLTIVCKYCTGQILDCELVCVHPYY